MQRGNFRLLITFGSLKIPIKISVLFSFRSFIGKVVQLGFKKGKFGDFKGFP